MSRHPVIAGMRDEIAVIVRGEGYPAERDFRTTDAILSFIEGHIGERGLAALMIIGEMSAYDARRKERIDGRSLAAGERP